MMLPTYLLITMVGKTMKSFPYFRSGDRSGQTCTFEKKCQDLHFMKINIKYMDILIENCKIFTFLDKKYLNLRLLVQTYSLLVFSNIHFWPVLEDSWLLENAQSFILRGKESLLKSNVVSFLGASCEFALIHHLIHCFDSLCYFIIRFS